MTDQKIYCTIYFPSKRRAFALDRNYQYITDDKELWRKLKLEDVVEVDSKFFPTFDHQSPLWARQLKEDGCVHIALWTGY